MDEKVTVLASSLLGEYERCDGPDKMNATWVRKYAPTQADRGPERLAVVEIAPIPTVDRQSRLDDAASLLAGIAEYGPGGRCRSIASSVSLSAVRCSLPPSSRARR